jgi:hypothetical protein
MMSRGYDEDVRNLEGVNQNEACSGRRAEIDISQNREGYF